uniref:uncharacterized protein LOC122599246 n=1 Tax=Erigeron canadensis TaxID=72917 RepID=UPI001CB93094|nr:uncharacterized protein LOC122599246 [Erigeron canadensis]XP_043627661.1 uncharacterized protein LOC122599246 [Erigeron canadensis]XP_043627662.1 uncharacterized protein LOC122599246 [Erigeron canadensis]
MEESQQLVEEEDDHLEKGLLLSSHQQQQDIEEEEVIVYSACLQGQETEEAFIKLKTAEWILYSLLMILAWGFGLLMLLYTPLRRYILRRTFRSRKLYLTPDSIVYKITKPLPFPCFGVLNTEKHVLLASVSDVVIHQGYLQSRYGVYSIRIENIGVTRPPSDHVQIQGIAHPQAFRKAVLMRLLALRNEDFSRQTQDSVAASTNVHSYPAPGMSPLRPPMHDTLSHVGEFAVLQKLDEVATSLKRVQSLFEEHQPKSSVCID